MSTDPNATNKKWPFKRTILLSILVMLTLAGIYLYHHFNQILSDSLLKSFNTSVISDVYELKFENLRVNPIEGSIRVFNVSMLPREKPLKDYPYINSSFSLKAESLLLQDVVIGTLLTDSRLILRKMHITKPEIGLSLHGQRHIMLPYSNDPAAAEQVKEGKRPINSFLLTEFILRNASLHSINSRAERQFSIEEVDIVLTDLNLQSDSLAYLFSVSHTGLSIGSITGDLQKGPIKHISFSDFNVGIDSIEFQYSLDTIMYRFDNFTTALRDLDIQTADSTYHVVMKSFDLSYRDQAVDLKEVSFKPNVTHAVLQRDFKYQHTEFSGSLGKLELKGVNFDSLMYGKSLYVDEIELENVKASIFKDKTKPMDSTRFPVYLGQAISTIKIPLRIRKVNATKVELENIERKPDSTLAVVNIDKTRLEVENITNLAPKEKLMIRADAFINGKVRFKATLLFSYAIPEFNFEGYIDSFKLPDLNPLIQAYTPAKINSGIADEISFSGVAKETEASGTMKFLYHDLEVGLEVQEKAKWKSDLIAFAVNTLFNSSNPVSEGTLPREVKFHVQRDMNKAFVNVIIKSVLNGLKETMIMNKENRKNYKESKKNTKDK